jgi:uncharacterized protein DUF4411
MTFVYIVDASSWISIEKHPAQNLILHSISRLIEAGKIQCPPESWAEVKKCPWVLAWLQPNKDRFVRSISDSEYFMTVGKVTFSHSTMAGARRRKERADQYVVAMASYLNATTNPRRYKVVCEESAARRPSRKMTTACVAMGIECIGLFRMLRDEFPEENWP